MKIYNSTLCYIEQNHQYLMLHRVKKEQDINAGKWIGVGGKFEEGESPEECLVREVREETGLHLTRFKLRGIVTFVTPAEIEYMFLYTADGFRIATEVRTEAEPCPSAQEIIEYINGFDCTEGNLRFVDIDQIESLPLWEGDRIFLRLLREEAPFFSLKLLYDAQGHLQEAVLDGKAMQLS